MERRRFLELSAGAIALTAINGCTQHQSSADSTHPTLTASDYHSTRRVAETKFGRIAYIERGTGDPALFLHGFPLNSFQWRGVLDPLSDRRRCVAPDFLGLGFTEVRENQSVAPNAQVEMLLALLDSLSIKSVDVIANDSGGAIAQLLVAWYHSVYERCSSLIATLNLTALRPPSYRSSSWLVPASLPTSGWFLGSPISSSPVRKKV